MNPLDTTIEQAKAYNASQQTMYDATYMTAKEVEQLFKISLSRQSQLVKEGRVVGVIQSSQRCLYIRNVASQWFEAYAAEQQARINTRETKKRKAGRPKKDAEAWRVYTCRGVEQRIEDKYKSRVQFMAGWSMQMLKWFDDNNLPKVPGNEQFDAFIMYRDELRTSLGLKNSL